MRFESKHLLVVFVLFWLGARPVQAQDFGFGIKASTLGIGVDGAYAINDRFSLRGGVGFVTSGSVLNDLLPDEIEGVEATSQLPSPSFTLGVDVRVAGPFRVMGGLLFQSDDYTAFGELNDEAEIGDGTYFPPGSLNLTLNQRSVKPFIGIGFGEVHRTGLGFFADLALAFGGGGSVVLGASEELTSVPGFNEDLAVEEARLNDEWGSLKSLYPVVQFGVSYGFSR